MPTSAAGSSRENGSKPRRTRRATRGFTLLELIVVIAIIAMATAGVSFALRDSSQAGLDREAERLAALLESARAQSRASGVSVRWRPVAAGFLFEGLPPGALPGHWQASGMHAQPALPSGAPVPALQLGPDPIIAAQQVLLTFDGPPAHTRRIATDGLRPFTVSTP